MMSFMSSQRLGDELELTYRNIYSGGGAEFGINVVSLVNKLGRLAEAGMITNMTRRNMEAFLTQNMSLSEMKIISKNTNDVVLVNTDIHEQESFDLAEYITWITDELCKDPLMKEALCGRESYEGVRKVLNSYADKEHNHLIRETWIDFYICGDEIFYTKKDEDGIHLYVREKDEDCPAFLGMDSDNENERLAAESLRDGRIYHFADGTVFAETDCGYIVQIRDAKCDGCARRGRRGRRGSRCSRCRGYRRYGRCYSRIGGTILNQSEDGSLLLIKSGKLMGLKPDGRRRVLVNNANFGMTCVDGDKVFWKSRFRRKEFEKGSYNFDEEYVRDVVKPCLKADRVSKEMLWKGLLLTLYDFDYMEFDNKIGNRLRFARFFDKLPVPFTIDEIGRRLSEIEQYCYCGDIVKRDGYAEAMEYLMSVEDEGLEEGLDEKQTFDALVYLLDNVSVNPYGLIAANEGTNEGTKVMDCMDFFFGGAYYV